MLELMITVAIAGILSAIAGPGMLDFIRGNRLSTAARQLDADLLVARREAIKRNNRVLVCPVGSVADKCGSGTTAWAQGWLVCYDADQSGDCDDATTGNPNPIRRHGAIEATLTLTGPAGVVRFNANGTQGRGGRGQPDLHDHAGRGPARSRTSRRSRRPATFRSRRGADMNSGHSRSAGIARNGSAASRCWRS